MRIEITALNVPLISLLAASVLSLSAFPQSAGYTPKSSKSSPVVVGHGVSLFKVGPLLFSDDFEHLKNWIVQLQERNEGKQAKIETKNKRLDCFVPGCGCTVWFKQRLKTRVTISYDVLCPTPKSAIEGLQPRDINHFWMAADPVDPVDGLFDSARYTGAFSSYDKMYGYYASTGGGTSSSANATTRMRRYPREVAGKPAEHLALNFRDGKQGYLITPDKWMHVQLVAYDDVIQYIVDGKLIYEIASGDKIQVETRDQEKNE
ncbi:MAG: hypothetical protein HOH33_07710 [Verrucomicrobia bacterium]|jgi:hypothetical protein|nr:hypothetical protein [Verrucomicrobiota bacterium]